MSISYFFHVLLLVWRFQQNEASLELRFLETLDLWVYACDTDLI